MSLRRVVTNFLPAALIVLAALLIVQPVGLAAQSDVSAVISSGGSVEPITVDLSDVAAGARSPEVGARVFGQHNRASEADMAAFRAAARALSPNGNVQITEGGPGAPDPLTGFDAIDINKACGGPCDVVPPDPDMAAGPNHLIAVVNLAFEIYDKAGNILMPALAYDDFFAAVPECLGGFDPTIVYDEEADRFVLGVDGGGDYFCAAGTATSDPLGSWHIYPVEASWTGEFHDYPHTGVGEDAIYVGSNQFGGGVPGGFEGRVWALDKWQMYDGLTMDWVTFSTTYDGGTPQPLHLHGYLQGTWPSTGVHYFLTDYYDGGTMWVWEWPNALGGGVPTVVSVIDLVAETGVPGGFPLEVPQLGGLNIEANDWRFRGFEYRNGYGWTADTIACNPGSGQVDCVRWAELDLTGGSPVIVQAGVYGSDDEYRIFPDLAANHCNDVALGYTKSNSSMYPGIWYTGRESIDPYGTLQPEAELKAGDVTYVSWDGPPHRWGDYTGMTIDPDGLTFWYLGEYSKDIPPGPAANWGTYVGSFVYPDCTLEEPTMHVADIEGFFTLDYLGRSVLRMHVSVDDYYGDPLSGVAVEASMWTPNSGPFVRTRYTKPSGAARFHWGSRATGTWTICVDDLTLSGYIYDSGDNIVTCMDFYN